ncbi:MAG: hypothetical protein CVU29_02250 [Betaproteobacteria bacterium HGW-Betaproteobacteria-22]|nr:MAG: hypothetical protein CVU29_02250 [Betaproteobacteria bacterium HGW-Betaproteobacteria-22]
MTKHLLNLTENKAIGLLTLIAGLIAWRVMYIQHGWINDDSTLYFEVAKRFSAGEWRQGFELYSWSFYPLIIAALHQVSNVNLHVSAQILAVGFYCITAFSLSKLIQLAGGDKLAILCGNLLLFSSTYITGDVFAMLLRDQGFWAFFLVSLVFFIRYTRDCRLQDALLWQASIIVATLFRVEGIAYAFFLPIILLAQSATFKTRLVHLIKINLLHLSLIIVLIIAFFLENSLNASHLGRLNEIISLFSVDDSGVINPSFAQKSAIYGKEVLGKFLDGYASLGLTITLISVVAIKCFKVAGGLTSLLIIAARGRLFTLPKPDAQKVLLAACAIAILNAAVIISRSFVLSSRYVIAFGFLMMIFAALYGASVIRAAQHKQTRTKWQLILILLSVVLISAGLIKNLANKRADYNYEQQAVAWAKQYSNDHDMIYYDNARLRYYAGAPWAGREGDTHIPALLEKMKSEPKPYTCLLLRAEADEPEKLNQMLSIPEYREIKRFTNKSGNRVLVLCRDTAN